MATNTIAIHYQQDRGEESTDELSILRYRSVNYRIQPLRLGMGAPTTSVMITSFDLDVYRQTKPKPNPKGNINENSQESNLRTRSRDTIGCRHLNRGSRPTIERQHAK